MSNIWWWISPYNNALTGLLKTNNCYIEDKTEILQYINIFPTIFTCIEKAVYKARELFDDTTELSLEMFFSPEDQDDYYPTLYIRQYNYEPFIMDKINEICRDYESLLSKQIKADWNGWFLTMTDYQLPKYSNEQK